MADEYLLLKWGTLKGWNLGDNEAARAAARRYDEGGPVSAGCMTQHDTPEQQRALCDMIDAIKGPITLDWEGRDVTKEEAKKYVLEYNRKAA
jgi:hypothetical protein